MKEEKVYIISVNHNGHKDTIEFLESVLKLDYENYQIILIDNSNGYYSLNKIFEWASGGNIIIDTKFKEIVYPLNSKPIDYYYIHESQIKTLSYNNKLIIIKAKENKGFSAANNIALNLLKDKGSFFWLLNNDTIVEKGSLKELIYFFKSEKKKLGILGSKLISYQNPKKIQSVGGKFNRFLFSSTHIGEGVDINHNKEFFEKIDFVIGASMFVSNRFLSEVGILNESYFLYYEELDWTFRAKKINWTIDWCEKALVYHKEGMSIGTSSDYKNRSFFSEKQVFISRKIFYKKFFKPNVFFWITSFLIILNRIKRKQYKLAFMFLKILFINTNKLKK